MADTIKNKGFHGFFLILLMVAGEYLQAQSIVGRQVLPFPTKYMRPTENTTLLAVDCINNPNICLQGKPWVVYSDRPDNLTYTHPEIRRKNEGKKIEYLESFFVLADSGEFIHIIQDPGLKKGMVSAEAVDIGWVQKKNMLLWEISLGDRWAYKIKKRVLLMHPSGKAKKIKFFSTPLLKKHSLSPELLPQTYFVYKTDEKNQAVLLGKGDRIQFGEPHQNLIGWIGKEFLIEKVDWVYLEPNWEISAVKERKNTGRRVQLYKDSTTASRALAGMIIPKSRVVWEEDTLDGRRRGSWFRYPVISYHDQIAKVGIFVPKRGVFVPAYTPSHMQGYLYSLTKFSKLMDRVRLAEVIGLMDQLVTDEPLGNARFSLQSLLGEMLRPYVGPRVSMAKLSRWTLAEISQTIFGLQTQHQIGADRLQDLIDEGVVEDNELAGFLAEISLKKNELKTIFNSNDFPYGFPTEEGYYYWIDEDLLP